MEGCSSRSCWRVAPRERSSSAAAVVPATRTLPVEPPLSVFRLAAAGGLILVALLWLGLALRKQRRRARVLARIGSRQLRTIGRNGRPSPERYLFRDFCSPNGEVKIAPEDMPGGALGFTVRQEGTVDCAALEQAKVIHSDRPTVLATSAILAHGTAFAMVHGQRAVRYVYLDDDPTGDELHRQYVADAQSYEAELHDSGVFVILDEHENLPKHSARLEASQELFPESGDEIFDSDLSAKAVVPSDPGREIPVSDEGIVIMDSSEGEIMDSQELTFVDSDEATQVDLDDTDIKMADLLEDSGDDGV